MRLRYKILFTLVILLLVSTAAAALLIMEAILGIPIVLEVLIGKYPWGMQLEDDSTRFCRMKRIKRKAYPGN